MLVAGAAKAVRVVHLPTGTTAEAINGTGVEMRRKAMSMLKAKIAAGERAWRPNRVVRDYSDWSEEDWRKPEERLDDEMRNGRRRE